MKWRGTLCEVEGVCLLKWRGNGWCSYVCTLHLEGGAQEACP